MNTVIHLTFEWEEVDLALVDAFVALGGMPNKEGTISKNTLIEIIKTEFELTIDMEVTPLFLILASRTT